MSYKDIQKWTFKGIKLYQAIVLLVVIVMGIALATNATLIRKQMGGIVNLQLGMNATRISNTVATAPEIVTALKTPKVSEGTIITFISNISNATNASVVVFDATGKLVALYNPTNNSLLENSGDVSEQISMMENLPVNIFKKDNIQKIFDKQNKLIGYVIVGFPEDVVGKVNQGAVDIIVFSSAIALAIGVLGALLLAKMVKNTLFGYEPAKIAKLLQERSTLLDTVKEGVFAVDVDCNLYLINICGMNILAKSGMEDLAHWYKKPFAIIAEDSEVRKVLKSGKAIYSVNFDIHGVKTVGDIIPVNIGNKLTGVIVSLNEKTAVKEMAEQLSGVTNYADALRAQTHEFMNKMHVISGLMATDNLLELKKYVKQISVDDGINLEYLTARIKDPLLSSFLIGKKSRANELQIEFNLSNESSFPTNISEIISINDIILIAGNLLENSFEALRYYDGERIVNLDILTYTNELIITVENNGPAIAAGALTKIFEKGYTTKGSDHGVGLALVKETLNTINGKIYVESDILNGTVFTVEIPLKEKKGVTS